MSTNASILGKFAVVIAVAFAAFLGVNSFRTPPNITQNEDSERLEILTVPSSALTSIIRGNGSTDEMIDLIDIGMNAISKYPRQIQPEAGYIELSNPREIAAEKPPANIVIGGDNGFMGHANIPEVVGVRGNCNVQIGWDNLPIIICGPSNAVGQGGGAPQRSAQDVEHAITKIDTPEVAEDHPSNAGAAVTLPTTERPPVTTTELPGGVLQPAHVQDNSSVSEDDDLKYIAPVTYTASIGYPATYKLNEQFTVTVAVTKGDNPKVTREKTIEMNAKGNHVIDETALMSPAKKMQATLLYDDLRKEPLEPVRQPVYKNYSTLWTWRITPDQVGTHHITILLNTVLPEEQPNAFSTRQYEIIITESLWSKISRIIGPLVPDILKSDLINKLVYAPIVAFALWLIRRMWRLFRAKKKLALAKKNDATA